MLKQSQLMLSSYRRLLGEELLSSDDDDVVPALYNAPFALVAHNTEMVPIFNYGNRQALRLFEMDWDQFTSLPSRQSAQPDGREERARLLKQVTDNGFIRDYKGIRISSTGRRFYIDQTTVWNLTDEFGEYRGQAAAIFRWENIEEA